MDLTSSVERQAGLKSRTKGRTKVYHLVAGSEPSSLLFALDVRVSRSNNERNKAFELYELARIAPSS